MRRAIEEGNRLWR